MARIWTDNEEKAKRLELEKLYVNKNMSIGEIARKLKLGKSTVYDRLIRLKIKTMRSNKAKFNNKRTDIVLPSFHSNKLSELIGIMLGDGHLTKTQLTVTLGNKENKYVNHVAELISKVFNVKPKIIKTKKGYFVVYFGSTVVVHWLLSMGLTFNKVKNQVNVPPWIFSNHNYVKGFLRGFFDTDGSVYKLRYGIQISLTNRSIPLLKSSHRAFCILGFNPSKVSKFRVYLTRRKEITRFFKVIKPANHKHQIRFKLFSEVK